MQNNFNIRDVSTTPCNLLNSSSKEVKIHKKMFYKGKNENNPENL